MKIVRKNNKYCTIKKENLNATIIGNPTIDNNFIANNFSSNNKLLIPIQLDPTKTYEIQVKFKLDSLNSDNKGLIGVSTSGIFMFWVDRENKLVFGASNDTLSWDIVNFSGTTTLTADTWYWAKCKFTGTSYEVYLSTDGLNWSLEGNANSSTPANNGNPLTLYLGNMHSANWYLKGFMDLKECYIKSNNNIVWQGVEKKYYGIRLDALVSLNKVGSLTINDGIASGFSSSNYLESTDNISLGSNFELYTEFTTGYMDPNQEYQVVFSGKTNQLINYGTQYRTSYGSYLQYNVGNGSSWLVSDDYKFGSHSISSYTKYYVKLTFNGSVYKSYISTDGQTWEQDWSYTTSQVVPSMKALFGVGRSLSQAWLGSININTAYVILNGIKYTFTM